MSTGDAIALNTLLNHLLGKDGPVGPVSSYDAMKAASHLAEKANKALMAGLNGSDVTRLWPDTTKKRPRRSSR